MAKNYYRSEYSGQQWKALIDKATELGCQITQVRQHSNNRRHRPGEPNYSNYRERRTRQSCMGRENTRHEESTKCGKCSPRDTTKAIAQLFAKAGEWLSSSRSASRE